MSKPSPKRIYKYFPPERIGTVLGKLLIRFSQASVMNDAFELRPAYEEMGPRDVVERGVRERLEAKHPWILAQIRTIHDPETAEKLFADIVSAAADHVGSPENYERSVKELYQKLDENSGILSLSETPLIEKMWCHYADGGRGFLIEFDASHDWFWAKRDKRDSIRHLRRVKYRKRKPQPFLNVSDDIALYTKGLKWKEEREWRIIRGFNDAKEKVGPDGYGKDVLLFEIPPSCITSVVIGYRATEDSISQLKTAVSSNPALSHVAFKRAVLDNDDTIRIEPEP